MKQFLMAICLLAGWYSPAWSGDRPYVDPRCDGSGRYDAMREGADCSNPAEAVVVRCPKQWQWVYDHNIFCKLGETAWQEIREKRKQHPDNPIVEIGSPDDPIIIDMSPEKRQ